MPAGHAGAVDLRTLSYFVAVVDRGTVGAAAESLLITQPGLSRQLRQLEKDLGVDLFDRTGRRLVLTPAGAALLPRARDLLADARALRTAATVQRDGRLERFTIAAPLTTLTDIVSPFVATMGRDDPTPSVIDLGVDTPVEALRHGADMVIAAQGFDSRHDRQQLPALPVFAYVPPDHEWAARGTVTLPDLLGASTIALPAATPAREAVDTAMRRHRLDGFSPLEASNGTIAQALAAAGRGIAVVSDDPRFDLVGLRVLAAVHEPVAIRLGCGWSPGHPGADVLRGIAERVAAWVERRYGADAA